MIVDISGITGVDGSSCSFSGEITFEDFSSPVKVEGTVKNYSEQYVLNCDMETSFVTECARCLEATSKTIKFSMEEAIGSEDCLECLKIVQNTIDITEAVYTHLMINLSQKFLCKEDCKGLCFTCGTNLNEGECKCDREVIDSRFEVLKKLMNKHD